MTRFRRFILLGSVAMILPAVFVYDVIRAVVDLEVTGLRWVREILLLWTFASAYLLLHSRKRSISVSPAKDIGRLLTLTVAVSVVFGIISFTSGGSQGGAASITRPNPGLGVLWGSVSGLLVAASSLSMIHSIRGLVLFRRRKNVVRNFNIFFGFLITSSLIASPLVPLQGSFLLPLTMVLTTLMIIVISFRQNWIVYLTRREKLYVLTYSGLLFIASLFLAALLYQGDGAMRELEEFSQPLTVFAQTNALLGAIYFGMTFVSTLFHLPTAEVYERKQSELTSLHNLTRLTTQVLDFDTLVDTVAQMTLEVCGADAVWLELVHKNRDGEWSSRFVACRNIAVGQVERAAGFLDPSIRSLLLDMQKIVTIDDTWGDRRTEGLRSEGLLKGSMVSIPLLSQHGVIGILHASKEMVSGFDKDDVDVLTSFGDHVTIAIENARLIAQSIERERFQQELLVARRMQRQLLPQVLPDLDSVGFAAMSESSMEVGGDYYDVVKLSDTRWAIAVGDVSGKGVSAAFYMAEVKGIVLSLSKVCSSPKELLSRANQALRGSLEKKSFVSLIYAILDTRRGTLLIARGGHCPLVRAHAGGVDLLRPGGMGLGIADAAIFEGATEEQYIELRQDDVCVMYTDGITEARSVDGEEYGYERLRAVVGESRGENAEEIKMRILESVRTFVGQATYNDDMTLVVLKWLRPVAARRDNPDTDGSTRRKQKETIHE